jgi:hypothetical protein
MNTIRFGRWELSCDPESTRKAYAALSQGSPEKCGCEPCLNFAAARDQIYAPDVRALFANLGISSNREAEIYYMARLESGRHLYGGWFHFVGTIVSGADAAKQVGERTWQPDLERTTDDFSLGFSSRVALVRKPFAGLPLVQLEFTARVPWVLMSPEPG